MRLVSVVVPDWLMATTRVSLMSARRPKPGQLGGRQRLDPEPSVRDAGDAARRPGSGRPRAAVPWPITWTRSMRPSRRPVAHVGGQHVVAERDVQRAVALDELAAQRLAEADRAPR